jgi:hypothetical protein
LECAITAKKYMLPLLVLHPYVAGSLIAAYWGRGRFDPSKNALVLDANNQLNASLTKTERRAAQDRLEEMVRSAPAVRVTERVAERVAEHPAENEPRWASLQAGAEPILDASGEPVLHVRSSGQITPVGIARTNITNIMSDPEGVEFATDLVKARLSEELKPAAARKTARSDVESDFVILRRLLEFQPSGLASVAKSADEGPLDPARSFPQPANDSLFNLVGQSAVDPLR